MAVPSLQDLKRHLHIRHDLANEDLQMKLDAAIDAASQILNRPVPWLATVQPDEGDAVYADVPPSVRAAILMMAAELYANREESITGSVYTRTHAAENMLRPFRVGLGV